jgi:hypothetical protein
VIEKVRLNETDAQVVARGVEAWRTVKRARQWRDWIRIGLAIETGRRAIMSRLGLAKPTGRLWSTAFGAWLAESGFDEIDAGTRSRLLNCVENRVAITAWRQTLSRHERSKFNHPNTVWRHWHAARRQAQSIEQKGNKPLVGFENQTYKASQYDDLMQLLKIERYMSVKKISELEKTILKTNIEIQDRIFDQPISEGSKKRPGNVTCKSVDKLLDVIFNRRSTIGDVVFMLREFHRIAYRWSPFEIYQANEASRRRIVSARYSQTKLRSKALPGTDSRENERKKRRQPPDLRPAFRGSKKPAGVGRPRKPLIRRRRKRGS